MAVAQEVSAARLAGFVGREIDVIIDEVDEEGALGRSKWDAPEIDGSVFLNGDTDVKPGDIVRAKVAHADEYDLWAEREKPRSRRSRRARTARQARGSQACPCNWCALYFPANTSFRSEINGVIALSDSKTTNRGPHMTKLLQYIEEMRARVLTLRRARKWWSRLWPTRWTGSIRSSCARCARSRASTRRAVRRSLVSCTVSPPVSACSSRCNRRQPRSVADLSDGRRQSGGRSGRLARSHEQHRERARNAPQRPCASELTRVLVEEGPPRAVWPRR